MEGRLCHLAQKVRQKGTTFLAESGQFELFFLWRKIESGQFDESNMVSQLASFIQIHLQKVLKLARFRQHLLFFQLHFWTTWWSHGWNISRKFFSLNRTLKFSTLGTRREESESKRTRSDPQTTMDSLANPDFGRSSQPPLSFLRPNAQTSS